MKKIVFLLAVLALAVKPASSQNISGLQIVGTDTFPLATVYHGLSVVILTDSQSTTIAQICESENYLRQQQAEWQDAHSQYVSLVMEQNNLLKNRDSIIANYENITAIHVKNEALLQQNVNDANKKYKKAMSLGRIKASIGSVGGFLIGCGVTSLVYLLKK